jgi:hypothetical protein
VPSNASPQPLLCTIELTPISENVQATGLAYSEQFNGFLCHSWTESLVGASWQAVDPTFGQTVADATHIKLIEGDQLADLLPLLDWVGKVKIRVLAVEH